MRVSDLITALKYVMGRGLVQLTEEEYRAEIEQRRREWESRKPVRTLDPGSQRDYKPEWAEKL